MFGKNLNKLLLIGTFIILGESVASEQYLTTWKSLDDVTKFSDYISENGIDRLTPNSFKIVENTAKELKGNIPLLLCVLTKANYEVATEAEVLSGDISSRLKTVIESVSISFDSQNLDDPKFYTIKWAWLLFLSQTKDHQGKEMIDGYDLYPISIAKELLDKQNNGLKLLAIKLKTQIESIKEKDKL